MKRWQKKTGMVVLIVLFLSSVFICCCSPKSLHADVISPSCHANSAMKEKTNFSIHKQDSSCDCKTDSKFITSAKEDLNNQIFFISQRSIITLVLESPSAKPFQKVLSSWRINPETLQNLTPVYLQTSILRL